MLHSGDSFDVFMCFQKKWHVTVHRQWLFMKKKKKKNSRHHMNAALKEIVFFFFVRQY